MLELKNIRFEAEDESNGTTKTILNNINLTIASNSFIVITGPNGSGKSSLAKIIMGMEKPSHGKILLDGKDITPLDVTKRAALGIGFAFQQPVRFKGMTVRDILEFASRKKLSTEEACKYLSQVGLCAVEYVDRELNTSLSGGEIKRIEIAMLLARNVKLSIFDEPEAGIDLWSFHNLIDIFLKIREETKGTIIIISHQERILEIANRIVVIDEGEITAEGSRDEILPTLLTDTDTCEYFRKRV